MLRHTIQTMLLCAALFAAQAGLAPSEARAQRSLACDSVEAKKFAANLMAKHYRVKKPYATPFSKKMIWPYLMGTFDMRRKKYAHKSSTARGTNHAWLAIHRNAPFRAMVADPRGVAQVSTCTYYYKGKSLKRFKADDMRLVYTGRRNTVKKRTDPAIVDVPQRKWKGVGSTLITLVYVSPKSSVSYGVNFLYKLRGNR